MATKKLAKREEVLPLKYPDLEGLNTHFQIGLIDIAARLSNRNITPLALTETLDLISRNVKAIGKMQDMAKKHLKALTLEHGEKQSETTQIIAMFGDYRVELRAQNTKLDEKRVQSMLAEKGISLRLGMDENLTYIVNESKLTDLIAKKKITKDELEACRHELKYNLQSPKKIGEPEDGEE